MDTRRLGTTVQRFALDLQRFH